MFFCLNQNVFHVIEAHKGTSLMTQFKNHQFILPFTIVPQLSKCLKFDAIWGVLN